MVKCKLDAGFRVPSWEECMIENCVGVFTLAVGYCYLERPCRLRTLTQTAHAHIRGTHEGYYVEAYHILKCHSYRPSHVQWTFLAGQGSTSDFYRTLTFKTADGKEDFVTRSQIGISRQPPQTRYGFVRSYVSEKKIIERIRLQLSTVVGCEQGNSGIRPPTAVIGADTMCSKA